MFAEILQFVMNISRSGTQLNY